MAGDIRIDDQHWPLVVVTFEGHAPPAAFGKFLTRMEECLARRERHAYLLDGRRGAMIDAQARQAQAEWLKRWRVELKQYSVATALLIDSAAVRFVLSAIYLIQAPVAPTETFATIDEAYAWLRPRFERAGLRLPPRAILGP